jgi:hypothetical protein
MSMPGGGYALAQAFVRISPNTDGFRTETVTGVETALAGLSPTIRVGADTGAAKTAVTDLRAYIDVLAQRLTSLRITADDKQVQATLASLYARLLAVDKMIAKPKVDIQGLTRAQATLLSFDAQLDDIARKVVAAGIELDGYDTAEAQLAALRITLMDLADRTERINLDVDDTAGMARVAELRAAIADLYTQLGSIQLTGPARDPATGKFTKRQAPDLGPAVSAVQELQAAYQGLIEPEQEAGSVLDRFLATITTGSGRIRGFNGMLGAMGTGAFTALARMNTLGGIIHWIIAGGSELLATALPATIAAAAAAFVGYQAAVEEVGRNMRALITTAEATDAVFGKSAGDILGTGHAIQAAQDAVNPQIFTMLGAGVDVARTHLSLFAQAGGQVLTAMQGFSSKLAAELTSPAGMGQIHQLLGNMVTDLIEFGQFFGQFGHALLNFAAAMPGLAEVILKVLVALSGLLLVISKLPTWVIQTVMVIEELYRWGGLLTGIVLQLAKAFGALGTLGLPVFGAILKQFGQMAQGVVLGASLFVENIGKMISGLGRFIGPAEDAGKAVSGFGGAMFDALAGINPVLLGTGVAAAAGLGVLVWWLSRSKDETQQWIDTTEKGITTGSNWDIVSKTASDLAQNTQRLADAQKHLSDSQSAANREASITEGNWSGISVAYTRAAGDVQALTSNQQRLVGQLGTVGTNINYLAETYHTGYAGALALATMANVNLAHALTGTSQQAIQNRLQITDLVLGYQAMGQQTGQIGADMNILGVQAALAGSKVTQLNQALQAWIGDVTGLTGGLAGLNNSIDNMGLNLVQGTSQSTSFSNSLGNTTTNSTTLSRSLAGTAAASSAAAGAANASGTAHSNLSKSLSQASRTSQNLTVQAKATTDQIARMLTSFTGSSAGAWTNFNQAVTRTWPPRSTRRWSPPWTTRRSPHQGCPATRSTSPTPSCTPARHPARPARTGPSCSRTCG